MSKKFIIELEDEPSLREDSVNYYKCVSVPWWSISDNIIKRLVPYDPDEKANTDFDAGYAEGLRELWGAIETGLDMSKEDRVKYLGHCYLSDLQKDGVGPEEFISGIRKYKEAQKAEQEIKVGDEIISPRIKVPCVVVRITDSGRLEAFGKFGAQADLNPHSFVKTGRHFSQIAEVLEQMKGE